MLYTINYIPYSRTIFIGAGVDIYIYIYIYIFTYIYTYTYGYNLFVILYSSVVLVWMIEYRLLGDAIDCMMRYTDDSVTTNPFVIMSRVFGT